MASAIYVRTAGRLMAGRSAPLLLVDRDMTDRQPKPEYMERAASLLDKLMGSFWSNDEQKLVALALEDAAAPPPDAGDAPEQELRAHAALASARCQDCPPVGYPTDETRCTPCDRRSPPLPKEADKDDEYDSGRRWF